MQVVPYLVLFVAGLVAVFFIVGYGGWPRP